MALARTCLLFIIVAAAAEAAANTSSPSPTTTASITPSKEPLPNLIYKCDGGKTYWLNFTAVADYDSYFITDGQHSGNGPIYGSAFTNCSTPIQNTTGPTATVTLGNCNNNPFVYLMNGHSTGNLKKVVGGKSFHEYELQCKIPSTGIDVTVKGAVGVKVPTSPATKSLDPFVNLTMQFTDEHSKTKATFMLGETLILDIHDNSDISAAHGLKLLTCNANAKQDFSGDALEVYSGPKTPSGEVFVSSDPPSAGHVKVKLHAFRFVSSETVYMQCNVRVCSAGDSSCLPASRRRRAADSPDSITTVDGSFTIVQSDSDKPTASGQALVLPWRAFIVSMVAVTINIFMRK